MRLAIVIGTRPELIKMAPVMRELKRARSPFYFIHSNQHYSAALDSDILENLALPPVDFHLKVGSGPHGAQTGKIMAAVEGVLAEIKPDWVIVHGDTNTTLGAALCAVKMHIKVAHVEAGLRSFDYSMPEEINRMLTDRISDLLFTPSSVGKKNLIREGIAAGRIHITGNTVVDALHQHIGISRDKSKVLSRLKVAEGSYIMATAHRPENVDNPGTLKRTISLLSRLSRISGRIVIFPIHPRTKSNLAKFQLIVNPEFIRLISPLDYLDTLKLIESSCLVVTDSGGLQEEAYLLKRPLITIRSSTERPETLSANFIVGLDAGKAVSAYQQYMSGYGKWKNTLGDGKAAEKIVAALVKNRGKK